MMFMILGTYHDYYVFQFVGFYIKLERNNETATTSQSQHVQMILRRGASHDPFKSMFY
jgi:hypothetical protein